MPRRWLFALVASIVFLVCLTEQDTECKCLGPCTDEYCQCSNSSGNYSISCSICDSRTRLIESTGIIHSHDLTASTGYTNFSTCSILIQSPLGTTIRLYLNVFKTECTWDYLHIHDGISPFDPTLAVYGGYLVDKQSLLKQDQEILSSGNNIYLVFRPDEFVNDDGFSITYKVDGCPKWCSEHGDCVKGSCDCDTGWAGDWCDIVTCNCQNGGVCDGEVCDCPAGYGGDNCEEDLLVNRWSYLPSTASSPGGRVNFGGALIGDDYWVFGGYHHDGTQDDRKRLAKYNVLSNTWTIETESGPVYRDGHTLTAHQSDLYMFGGQINYQITEELWKFSTTNLEWHQINPPTPRIKSMGHCAVLINGTIYFIGGIDGNGIVILDVQTYNVDTKVWDIISHRDMTRAFYDASSKERAFNDGRIFHGRFAPSCVYNEVNGRITVFGGLNTSNIMGENPEYWIQSEAETVKESTFAEFDVFLNNWGNFYIADINTVPMLYLAAVQTVDRNMIVFGGRYVNIGQTQCFSVQPYIVNVETGQGKPMISYSKLRRVGPVRMGMGSFVHDNSVYFVGGYNGKLHDDVIVYHISKCEVHTEQTQCLQQREDYTVCMWAGGTCSSTSISTCGKLQCTWCPPGDGFDKRCVACTQAPGCIWDQGYPDTCRATDVINVTDNVLEYKCRDVLGPSRIKCSEYKLCEHCKDECYWLTEDKRCAVNVERAHDEVKCNSEFEPCNAYTSCSKCIKESPKQCMWCQLSHLNPDGTRAGQCLDTSTYYALYPYGQCVQWSMANSGSSCPELSCAGHSNCTLCQAQPECGWCDDETGTGSGYCLEGTYRGSLDQSTAMACRARSWYYDTCPNCQCNGHSLCSDNDSCDECKNLTTGAHCDECMEGYYGDATNNGTCKPCDCSQHSTFPCVRLSGRCNCDTRGVMGVKCDVCSTEYRGDPKLDTCYEVLFVNKQYSPKALGGKYKANFVVDLDNDVTSDVVINVSAPAASFTLYIEITGSKDGDYSMQYMIKKNTAWSSTLKRSKYKWHKTPVEVKIMLTFNEVQAGLTMQIDVQKDTNQIDLKQFFIIFFACVVILLLVFLLAWTAKIRYSQYRNLRHQEIQLMERATRPFITHRTLFREESVPVPGRIFEVRPLALEPLKDEKYAVVSYLVSYPGPNDIHLAISSGSFMTSLPFSKVISNPNINYNV